LTPDPVVTLANDDSHRRLSAFLQEAHVARELTTEARSSRTEKLPLVAPLDRAGDF
jgi:hypothetical protein